MISFWNVPVRVIAGRYERRAGRPSVGSETGARLARRLAALAVLGSLPACATAQVVAAGAAEGSHDRVAAIAASDSTASTRETSSIESRRHFFRSRKDSLNWVWARNLAEHSSGYRVVVSLMDRHLWVLSGSDTLRSAPVAVASRSTLDYGGSEWTFDTPRGRRTVLSKTSDPHWIPPKWHYAEVAKAYGLKMRQMMPGKPITLSDGRLLAVRDSVVVVEDDSTYAPLPTDEEVVFDNTIFIPPPGTKNRSVAGELGKYRLDLGDGYYLHGTPDLNSIGQAATHGCVRLRDEDIEWLYENVPVGTRVYVF